ncbi:uncharacterized protein Dvir_GJ25600 [Drosophila virilis]|uniref:Uncharacterized protein n=1 Tax=Drosophila virilis TaxID=7244 RepID=A0A0Q9WAJ1_DROVI|nr:uncharacterized protein Dvir_GJ25600 [Drosophila virilis]
MRSRPVDHLNPCKIVLIQNGNTFAFCKRLSNAISHTGCRPVKLRIIQKLQQCQNGEKIKQLKRTLDCDKPPTKYMMRTLKCKAANFQQWQSYPNIILPKSAWASGLTAESLDKEDDRLMLFDMEQNDVMEVWRQIPNKDTLGYYGISSDIYKPEAIDFNQVIAKCLKKVTLRIKA